MKLLLKTIALFTVFIVNGAFGSPECGKVLLNKGKSNGKAGSTLEGQWPWQVTLYRLLPLGKYPKYICGGTLVSKRHVVTAAHCAVTRPGTKINLKAYLGQHNLKETGEKVQVSTVKKILFHPEYNQSSYYRDLAILELQDPVTFSDWVQPACLWPDSEIELEKIVGLKGSVVDWGMDDTGVVIEELSVREMPVVSQETCLRSYPEFYARFTSVSTYCAGSRDACNRVSGAGMVFEKDGSWYLRGVVSIMVAIQNKSRCDPTHYTIFADVAQALPWIKENIKDD